MGEPESKRPKMMGMMMGGPGMMYPLMPGMGPPGMMQGIPMVMPGMVPHHRPPMMQQ